MSQKWNAMDSLLIRKKFLDFFKEKNHTIVASSSLIPAEDPTLLFTNAGMNQFKDVFLGKEIRSYSRATSIQKCVRAGGKHNDLDQVGFTERHLTFFEMLGNFSFGDYFKQEAIAYAWEFLTQEVKLPTEKLYASVFREDQESYDIWHTTVGLPVDRIVRLDEKDNFWQMGDTGPCGPCTEIYLDHGKEVGCGSTTCQPGCDCARFIEIWNLVFMQYDRSIDGALTPLPKTGVDTGMGLERLCAVIQNKKTVFHIDSLYHLINKIEELSGTSYQKSDAKLQAAFHVLTDHVRSSSLLIADGCTPSNDGRGYVLRKIIRRAALFAQKISSEQSLFPSLAAAFIEQMKSIYPELEINRQLIITLLESEINRFATNLINGQGILQKYLREVTQQHAKTLSGEQAFTLYDTYGFPLELTELIAKEHGIAVDHQGFVGEMEQQRLQSGKKMKAAALEEINVENLSTAFIGYQTTHCVSTIQLCVPVDDHYWISTEVSPFYVESGGQVNDQGYVIINKQIFAVADLKKAGQTFNPAILVKIPNTTIEGNPAQVIKVGDQAECIVNQETRIDTVRNHTATHMLQAALLQVLGSHIKQAGSVVHPDYLRFDFTHHKALSPEEITKIEGLINAKIQEDITLSVCNTTLKDAKEHGVISFFAEKYNPESVRVVSIPGFSQELCGGTHASSTGIIGCLKIISETALSTGVRRIVAVTGPQALKTFQRSFTLVKTLSEQYKVKPEEVLDAIHATQADLQQARKTIKQLNQRYYQCMIPTWLQEITTSTKVPFLYLEIDECSADDLKSIATTLAQHKPGLYFMLSKQGQNRFIMMTYLSKECSAQIQLTELASWLQQHHHIKSGGSATLLQGGGTNIPTQLKHDLIKKLSA